MIGSGLHFEILLLSQHKAWILDAVEFGKNHLGAGPPVNRPLERFW